MKRVLITRPRAQADPFASALRAAGFEPVYLPVIEIRPAEDNRQLDRALSQLSHYEWVIFTSANGVQVVFDRPYFASGVNRSAYPYYAAVGPKTAEALRQRGVSPDLVPDEYIPEAILPGLGEVSGKWILLPRAEMAREILPKAIAAAGGIAHEITVYKTIPARPDPEGIAALQSGVDVITLTSPSAVQNLAAIVRQSGLDLLNLPGAPCIACIGPITEKAASEAGFANLAVAPQYTTDGLVQLIAGLKR